MSVPLGTSTAPLLKWESWDPWEPWDHWQSRDHWHHAHHCLLDTNVKKESKQETLNGTPEATAVPLATAAAIVVASASRIHNLVPYLILNSTFPYGTSTHLAASS